VRDLALAPILPLSVLLLACGTAPTDADSDATSSSSTTTGDAPTSTTTASETTTTTGPATSTPTSTTADEPAWPDACPEPIAPVPRSSARLAVDADGALRDEHGRDVLLRGVNTGGRSKWAPFVPFPIDPEVDAAGFAAAADEFYGRLPAWGVDVVRMPFSWEALEPTEGDYDARYLDRYAAMVDAAWAHGIAVVVDFHQDVYASPFCGDGFPLWTLPGDPGPAHHDCPEWGIKYLTDDGVRAAFDRFWADEDAIQTKFFAMWQQMIERVGDHPGVLGLEILNEPGWGTAPDIADWKVEVLLPFWTAAIAELRAHAGDDLLILYDNTGLEALAFGPTTHLRPDGDNLMYAPHLYDSGLINSMPWSGAAPEPPLADIAMYARANGLAVLLGEFGYGGDATGGPEWLTRTYDALDVHRISSTQWELSQSEELWNEEDLSMIAADGEPRPIVDVFVRPVLRAVAGTAPSFTWDPAAGEGAARWTGDGGVTELVLPARRFPDGPADVALRTLSGPEGACLTDDRALGQLRVSVPAGAEVELTFAD
jgi:endoglycosylceramidase